MKLILVVGPSGSGKDTLLRSAREHFAGNPNWSFVRRYITRPPDQNEDNFYVDPACFLLLKQTSFFISTWQAHTNLYGVPWNGVTDQPLPMPSCCLCSISRGAITDFEAEFADTASILVTAEPPILAERLSVRGRESMDSIIERLHRTSQPVQAKNLITFDNSAPLAESRSEFITLLEQLSH